MYKTPKLVNITPTITNATPLYEAVVHSVQIQKCLTPDPMIIKEPTPPRNPTPEPVKPRSPTPPRRPQTPPPTRQHYSPPPRPKVIPTSRRSSEARVVGLIKPSRREPRVIVPTVQKPKPVAVPVPAPEPVKPVVVVQPKSVTPPPTPVRPTPVSFYSKVYKSIII